jgi:hypothetical protein
MMGALRALGIQGMAYLMHAVNVVVVIILKYVK